MRCGIYVRVSTDEQRDNGYSIDSQLRMIKEYCEKNGYDIVEVYNDVGHSGKDLIRPEMQRLLKDIKAKKIEKLIAIKVDRLTRNNFDGFWLLNYCEEHNAKVYYFLTCKNPNCKAKGVHYSCDKLENNLSKILNDITRYFYDMDYEIITSNSTKNKDIKDIEKAIEKLKFQEKKLVDLYLSSSINVDAINHKNDMIKKEMENLNKKLKALNPDEDYKEYTIELSKKLEFDISIDENIFKINRIDFSSFWNDLDKKDKKEIMQKIIASMEIKRKL